MLPTCNPDFWRKLDEMIAGCDIIIDRPKHSRHPRYPEIIYPLDYGFLNGTFSMDGEGIDLWLGSMPEKKLNALFVTIDGDKKDAEIKLMIGCTDDELDAVNHFFNDYPTMKGLLIYREAES